MNRTSDLLFAAGRFAAAAAGEPEQPFKSSKSVDRGFGATPTLPPRPVAAAPTRVAATVEPESEGEGKLDSARNR